LEVVVVREGPGLVGSRQMQGWYVCGLGWWCVVVKGGVVCRWERKGRERFKPRGRQAKGGRQGYKEAAGGGPRHDNKARHSRGVMIPGMVAN
jgi:hypothetical protein